MAWRKVGKVSSAKITNLETGKTVDLPGLISFEHQPTKWYVDNVHSQSVAGTKTFAALDPAGKVPSISFGTSKPNNAKAGDVWADVASKKSYVHDGHQWLWSHKGWEEPVKSVSGKVRLSPDLTGSAAVPSIANYTVPSSTVNYDLYKPSTTADWANGNWNNIPITFNKLVPQGSAYVVSQGNSTSVMLSGPKETPMMWLDRRVNEITSKANIR